MNNFKLFIAKLLLSYSSFLVNKMNKQFNRKHKKIDSVIVRIKQIIKDVERSQGEEEVPKDGK